MSVELLPPWRVVLGEMRRASDAELMTRTRRGEVDAFSVLVDRHKHALVNYLTSLSRDRDRAEEISQATFVRLFMLVEQYDERGQFLPYLFRMATNLYRTEERKIRRRRLLLHVFSSNGVHETPSPQAEFLREEATERVTAALARLPLRYRSPLVLREIEGWSYKDIAAALDCREGTVKSRINRGREQLRRLLEPYWNGGRVCPQ